MESYKVIYHYYLSATLGTHGISPAAATALLHTSHMPACEWKEGGGMNDFVLYVSICVHINTLSTLQLHTHTGNQEAPNLSSESPVGWESTRTSDSALYPPVRLSLCLRVWWWVWWRNPASPSSLLATVLLAESRERKKRFLMSSYERFNCVGLLLPLRKHSLANVLLCTPTHR